MRFPIGMLIHAERYGSVTNGFGPRSVVLEWLWFFNSYLPGNSICATGRVFALVGGEIVVVEAAYLRVVPAFVEVSMGLLAFGATAQEGDTDLKPRVGVE